VDDVAKDLAVSPAYLTAYLGYEMGVQSKYDSKKPDREKASVSGERDTKELSEMLKKFINELVLCPTCRLPEVTMYFEKKNDNGTEIGTSCRSCGNKTSLVLRDKFKAYILNHAPKTKETPSDSPDVPQPKPKEKPKSRPRKEKEEDEEDDIEWSRPTSEDAVKQRRKDMLPDAVKNMVVLEDGHKKGDPCEDLKKFIASHPEGDVVSEVKRLQGVYGFGNNKRPHLLFDVLFEPNAPPNVQKHQKILSGLIIDEPSQMGVLECIEKLCTGDLLKKATLIIKDFYDHEIVEEETILKWYEFQLSSQSLLDQLQQFIAWLRNADEESGEESD